MWDQAATDRAASALCFLVIFVVMFVSHFRFCSFLSLWKDISFSQTMYSFSQTQQQKNSKLAEQNKEWLALMDVEVEYYEDANGKKYRGPENESDKERKATNVL